MSTQVCESPARFPNVAESRVAPRAGNALQHAIGSLVRYWEGRHARAHASRAVDAMSDINVHTLKDIGAPNWMVAEASSRDDGRALRLIDLYRS